MTNPYWLALALLAPVAFVAAVSGCGVFGDHAPTRVEQRLDEGRRFARQGKMAEAAEAFEDASYADPQSAEALYLLAKARLELGRSYPALDAIQAAQKLRADNGPQHILLGRIYLRLGRMEESEQAINEAVERWPDEPRAHYAFGLLRLRQERLGEAEVSLTRAVRAAPRLAGLQEMLGRVLLRLGRNDQAIARFQVALQQRSCDDLAYGGLAVALVVARQPGLAQEAFENAASCAVESQAVPWRAGLALAYAAEGQFDVARERFGAVRRVVRAQVAVALEARLSRAQESWSAVGCSAHETTCAQADERIWSAVLLLFVLGAADAAEAELREALTLHDGDGLTHWVLAEAFAELDRSGDALLEMERAVAWEPSEEVRAAMDALRQRLEVEEE